MAIKVQSIQLNPTTKKANVSLFLDTQADINYTEIDGVPADYTIEQGSSALTAAGELAFMKSDGTWNWV